MVGLSWSNSSITITLEETVDSGMAAYTQRAIKEASMLKPDIIFLEINTFGGRLDAAFEIVDAITEIKDSKTIAIVNKKAISAGALIALAADEMYMKPNTTIGDCAPIIQGQDGPKMLGEKIQSPLRAKFRGLAQKNGYNELLAMSMVSENLEVLKLTGASSSGSDSIVFIQRFQYEELGTQEKQFWVKKETLVREGELLTLTNTEAKDFGFSQGTIEGLDSLYSLLNVKKQEAIKATWSENLVRMLAQLSPILILIGLGSLYIEIKTPGFGIFGFLGIICLGFVFGGQHLAGASNHLGLILFVAGIVLILVEMVVLPGTWVAGMLGIICFIAALAISTDITVPDKNEFTLGNHFAENIKDLLYISLGAMILPIFFARYILPKVPPSKGVILAETMGEIFTEDLSSGYHVGDEGVSLNLLKPTGRVKFSQGSVEVQARSGYIDPDKNVRISSLENHQIWVELIGIDEQHQENESRT